MTYYLCPRDTEQREKDTDCAPLQSRRDKHVLCDVLCPSDTEQVAHWTSEAKVQWFYVLGVPRSNGHKVYGVKGTIANLPIKRKKTPFYSHVNVNSKKIIYK